MPTLSDLLKRKAAPPGMPIGPPPPMGIYPEELPPPRPPAGPPPAPMQPMQKPPLPPAAGRRAPAAAALPPPPMDPREDKLEPPPTAFTALERTVSGRPETWNPPRSLKELLVRGATAVADRVAPSLTEDYGLVDDDLPYLRQFLHPDQDHLPATTDRPSRRGDVSTRDAAPWRKLPPSFPQAIRTKLDEDDLPPLDQVKRGDVIEIKSFLPAFNGLANHRQTLGRDERG